MNSRFRIQASCLQLPASELTTSVHMKNAAANMEKISTVYARLRRIHVDDPGGEDDELDAIEAELEAGLVSAGVGRCNSKIYFWDYNVLLEGIDW